MVSSNNNTLSKEILKIVNANANNNPPPELCLIKKINGDYVDIILARGYRHLTNIEYIGSPVINKQAIVIYPNGKQNSPLVLCLTNDENYKTKNIVNELKLDYLNIESNTNQEIINTKIDEEFNRIFNMIYPVGSIYLTVNDVNPSLLFGGEWEQIEDRFLLGASSTYEVESEGGSKDAVVVEHNHTQKTHKHKNYQWNIIVAKDGNTGHFKTPTVDTTNKSSWNIMKDDNDQNRYDNGVIAENESTGEDGTDKNMPPYFAVYIWKRIG